MPTRIVQGFPTRQGKRGSPRPPAKVTDLPAGINHHWTKNIIASRDGTKLYVTVGSNSNVGGERPGRRGGPRGDLGDRPSPAAQKRLFASGLRNPNGLGWEPDDQRALDGGERTRRAWQRPGARLPDLGEGGRLLWLALELLGPACRCARQACSGPTWWPRRSRPTTRWASTWRRWAWPFPMRACRRLLRAASSSASTAPGTASRCSGYKVVLRSLRGRQAHGPPIDFLTGFLSADGKAYGRPVGVALDKRGALLVADDVGNAVWRVKRK